MTAKSWVLALLKDMLVDVVDSAAPCKISLCSQRVDERQFNKYTLNH